MAFKFIACLAFVAVASAQFTDYHHDSHVPSVYHHAAPVAVLKSVAHPVYKHVEVEAPAKYDFSYSVHDHESGDIKQQHETRDGDNVSGSYSLYDADGYHRVVEYTADEHNGFQAVVHREPPTGHKVAAIAPVVHKVVAAPVVHKVVAAPVAHHYAAAPVAHHYAAAPVAHHYAAAPAVYHHAAAPVVAKIVSAPVVSHYAAAPVAHYSHDAAHVTYNTPSSNYHY